LIGSFQKFFKEILTHNFFRYRSGFEAFLHLLIGDGDATCLHITIVVGGSFESKVLMH